MAKNEVSYEWDHLGGFVPSDIIEKIRTALWPMRGRTIRLTLTEVKPSASSPQKRYWHGVVVPTVHKAFHERGTHVIREEVHEYLKKYVCGLQHTAIGIDGEIWYPTRSIESLDKDEMTEAIEAVLAWTAEKQIPLDPARIDPRKLGYTDYDR